MQKNRDSLAACEMLIPFRTQLDAFLSCWCAKSNCESPSGGGGGKESTRERDHPPVVCCAARAHKIQFIIEKFHRLLSWCAHGANAWRLWHCVCMRSEILMRLSSFAHSGCRRSALVTQSTSAPNSGRKCDDWFHRWCYSLIVLLVIYLLEAAVWQEITDFLHKMNQFRLPLFDIMAYLSLFLGSVNVLLYKKTKS